MKKLLVVVLAAALVLGFAATASATVGEMGTLPNVSKIDSTFPDAKNETQQVKDDTAKMYALGVLEGLPNGTFAYDQTMTRAELAKVVTYLTNAVSGANALQTSKSSYPDVKTAVWYTGWVNNVTTAGQMKGYPNGKFGPNDKVTVAELLTATLRTLGYDDNLAGNWPYDYVAQAAKLGLTKNIDTNDVKRIATRRDLVQVASNILDQSMVTWDKNYNRFIPYASSAYRTLDSEDDYPFWSGWTDSVTWEFSNLIQRAPMDLLEYAFNARVLPDVRFNDFVETADDAMDAWYVDNFKAGEIGLCAYYYDADAEDADDYDYVDPTLASKYFISDNYTVFDLANMKADLIYTADGRGQDADGDVIYVDVKSSYSFTDDIEWDTPDKDLKVDGKVVRLAADDSLDISKDVAALLDAEDLEYAKVFYNEKGRVYTVTDLQAWEPALQGVLDSADLNDESIDFFTTSLQTSPDPKEQTFDIEDDYIVAVKDKAFVRVADLKQLDVLTIPTIADKKYIEDHTNHWFGTMLVLADELNSAKLTEGDDEVLTIGGKEYPYAVNGFDLFGYNSQYNETGGANKDYEWLDNVDDVDAALDANVKYATDRTGYGLTFLIHGNGPELTSVYGVVTDIDKSNVTEKVKSLTILNQKGEEVTYTLDKDFVDANGDALTVDQNVQLGSYVEVKVDADKVITELAVDELDEAGYPNPVMPANGDYTIANNDDSNLDIDRNGKRINLDGKWYLIDDSTVIWNTTWDEAVYDSADFDDAEIVDKADLKAADELFCEGYVVAKTKDGVLKRLYLVDAQVFSKTQFDVVTKVSKKADGWNISMLLAGTTIYDENGYFFGKDSDIPINGKTELAKNTFVAYTTTSGGKLANESDIYNWPILSLTFPYILAENPLQDVNELGNSAWIAYSDLAGDDIEDYVVPVLDKTTKGNDTILTLGNELGEKTYYYLADSVVVINVADDGKMTKGAVKDIKASAANQDRFIMAITADEEDNQDEIVYVFVFDKDLDLDSLIIAP